MTITVPADTPDFLPDTSGTTDVLLPLQLLALTGGFPSVSKTFALGKSYQALIATAEFGGPSGVVTMVVTLSDHLGNQYWTRTYTRSMLAAATYQFLFVAPCSAGGTLTFTFTGTLGSSQATIELAASVVPLASQGGLVRPDGRPYPNGDHAAHGATLAGGVLIAAPTTGQRILLASGQVTVQSPGGGNAYVYVQATINGTSFIIAVAGCGNANIGMEQFVIPPGGLLLDDATAVNYVQAGTPGTVFVDATYDLVA